MISYSYILHNNILDIENQKNLKMLDFLQKAWTEGMIEKENLKVNNKEIIMKIFKIINKGYSMLLAQGFPITDNCSKWERTDSCDIWKQK